MGASRFVRQDNPSFAARMLPLLVLTGHMISYKTPKLPSPPLGAERVRERWGMAVRARTRKARKLRRNATDAERILWRALREMRFPFNVRRQHPIGSYIADFAIPACKLVIEIDGGQHAEMIDADARRTRDLNARGYRVIRFWNNEVISNTDGVLQVIIEEVERAPTSP